MNLKDTILIETQIDDTQEIKKANEKITMRTYNKVDMHMEDVNWGDKHL